MPATSPPASPTQPKRAPAKIGLFGGSFNPAHAGHMHVAQTGLDRINLDEIWWIVARGNPLKTEHGDFEARLASARGVADHPCMKVLNIEAELGLTYTRDTLRAIKAAYMETDFVWLMGADNLQRFHHWKDWEGIVRSIPIAIVARTTHEITRSKFTDRFGAFRQPDSSAGAFVGLPAPAWIYLDAPLNPASSTELRGAAKASKD